jgi:hypothetical protein
MSTGLEVLLDAPDLFLLATSVGLGLPEADVDDFAVDLVPGLLVPVPGFTGFFSAAAGIEDLPF